MLKRYRCHKVVEAGRIASMEQIQADGYQLPGWSVTLNGEGLPRWLEGKHAPEVGGYFVRYEDGYTSYSPAAAFEAGYALEDLRGLSVPAPTMDAAAEMLWIVLANVSGGDWTKQAPEWQEAAARWRDNYFVAVQASKV